MPEKIGFEIHLAEHCNLNCAGCDNLSPLAEPEFVSVEEFMKDFKRMAELFNHECSRIHLLGGEPLLHPELLNLIEIARDNFTQGIINLYTNGILLPQQDDKFWQTCKKSNITLIITKYPINIDREKIMKNAEKFDIQVKWVGFEGLKGKQFAMRPLNLSGSGDMKNNFAMCYRACVCIALSHGKLFPCSLAPNIRHFNKYFKQNIPITEDDYIDIYQAKSGQEILKRLTQPIPLCRYCDLNFKTVKWRVSERKMEEWV